MTIQYSQGAIDAFESSHFASSVSCPQTGPVQLAGPRANVSTSD